MKQGREKRVSNSDFWIFLHNIWQCNRYVQRLFLFYSKKKRKINTFCVKIHLLLIKKNIQLIYLIKHYQKIESTRHRSICNLLFVSRLNEI